MSDASLVSGHLEFSRRQAFRQARANLLQTQGAETGAGQRMQPLDRSDQTLVSALGQRLPTHARFVLVEMEAVYPLRVGITTLGRSGRNDIPIADPYLSRQHCVIVRHSDDRVEVHDIASRNGTYVNGQRIHEPTLLKSGDRIQLGFYKCIFLARGEDIPTEISKPP